MTGAIQRLGACGLVAAMALTGGAAMAQSSDEDLAKKLANPIANLISLPLQYNRDEGSGPPVTTPFGEEDGDGTVDRLNIQPVWPLTLNPDWNVITRTIIPLINQDDLPLPGDSESGLGDILASQWLSPKELTSAGWTWGVGPAWLLPTATEDQLGAEKWGLGPTALALKQTGPWTIGGLCNHIWTLGGEDDRADVNATFLQPFLSYVTPAATTLTVNSESTYDWRTEEWLVPVNFIVSQMFAPWGSPMQLGIGARYWAESPDSGADDWGLRVQWTLLFPK